MALPTYATTAERAWRWIYLAICTAVFVFLIAPIVVVIPLSFNAEKFFTFTREMLSLDPDGWSLRWYDSLLTFGMAQPDAPRDARWWADMWANAKWVNAAKNSLFIGVASTALATVLGVGIGAVLGMLAAFRRGWLDAVIMRSGDVLLAIPQLVFALLAVTVLGPQGWVLVLVIGITHAPRVARVIRSATAGVVAEDYVLASQMYAVPQWKILGRDVLPNIMGPLMVEVGLRLTYSIGAVASLSFLGLGMQPPTPDWGLMINENRIALSLQPWGVLLPVIAIAVLTVGTNLLADAVATASAGRVRTTAKKGA